MGSIRLRKDTATLFFDFTYKGVRCRELTTLPDTPHNRHLMGKVLKKIEAEIVLGTFEYAAHFPSSPMGKRFSALSNEGAQEAKPASPLFEVFAQEWLEESRVAWKRSYSDTVERTINHHLVPGFGGMYLAEISKGDILKFRAGLGKIVHGGREGLSFDRINHIMTPLRLILEEGSSRYHFPCPFNNIKQLKVPRTEIDPFSLQEVNVFISNVRPDFRNYYTVRFFTGMRTSEIDGLKWQHVDLEARLIHVQETLVAGHQGTPKTVQSQRTLEMSPVVHAALQAQYEVTGKLSEFVFCTSVGTPLSYSNVSNRVWYPTLKRLGLKKRRPYQTRHTTATLWLAAGENPEWIAKQMGHSTTRMLFTVYSRFVPNLTRRDGSAFNLMLAAHLKLGVESCSSTS